MNDRALLRESRSLVPLEAQEALYVAASAGIARLRSPSIVLKPLIPLANLYRTDPGLTPPGLLALY